MQKHNRIKKIAMIVAMAFMLIALAKPIMGFTNSSNLIFYAPFDTNANSIIGGYTGTVVNAILNTSQSANGAGSYSFDGSGDEIQISSAIANGLGEFTMCMWVNHRDFATAGAFVSLDSATHAWVQKKTDGTNFFRLYVDSVEVSCTGNRTYSVDADFHQVCVSFSNSNNRVRGWGDGALECEAASAQSALVSNEFHLGLMGGSSGADYEGHIDEVMAWNVELTPTNVSDLYAGGSGLFYPFIAATNSMTVNYPQSTFYNNYNGSINLNTSINSTQCWINNSIWEYDLSDSFDHSFINVSSVPDGAYSLNITCQDIDSTNSSLIHTFTLDTVAPTFNTSLSGNSTTASLYNNFTVSSGDTNLLNVSIDSSCNVHYRNASVTSPHLASISEYVGNCSLGTHQTNVTVFDSAGNSLFRSYTWTSQATLRIYAFDSGGSPVTNFTIFVNGSNQGATTNGQKDLLGLGNSTYNVSIDAFGYGLEDALVPVSLGFDTYNFTLFVTNSIYFTFREEDTKDLLSNITISVELISDVFGSNYTTTNSSLYLDLLSPALYTIRYSAINYSERFYFFNLENRTSTNLTLYLAANNSVQSVTALVIDETGGNVEGAYIKVLKYDSSTNSYNLVQIAQTNFQGQTVLNLALNSEFYKFIIEYPLGTVKLSTSPTYIYGTTLNFQINLGGSLGETFYNSQDITHSLIYNNATSNFRYTYTDANNIVSQGCLYVYKITSTRDSLYNFSCANSPSSTILVGIDALNGTTYKAQAFVQYTGESPYLIDELYHSFGSDFLDIAIAPFWIFALTVIFLFIAVWDRTIALVIAPLPMLAASMFSLWAIPLYITILIEFIAVILAVTLSNKTK